MSIPLSMSCKVRTDVSVHLSTREERLLAAYLATCLEACLLRFC